MVYLAGSRCVEQTGVGSYQAQHGIVRRDLGADRLGDGPAYVTIRYHGTGNRKLRIGSLAKNTDGFVQMDERAEFKSARLDGYADVAGRSKAIDRQDSEGWRTIEQYGCVRTEIASGEALLQDEFPTRFRDELGLSTR